MGTTLRTQCGIALALVAAVVCDPARADDNALKLTISAERPTYRVGAPIRLAVILENTAPRPVTVNRRLELSRPELTLDIEDSARNKARWLPAVPPPPLTARDFVLLTEGQRIATTTTDLGRHLSTPLRPGRYTATATYSNTERGTPFGLRAWTGTVASNQISFEITERSSEHST
jgi:hypothetical protein